MSSFLFPVVEKMAKIDQEMRELYIVENKVAPFFPDTVYIVYLQYIFIIVLLTFIFLQRFVLK